MSYQRYPRRQSARITPYSSPAPQEHLRRALSVVQPTVREFVADYGLLSQSLKLAEVHEIAKRKGSPRIHLERCQQCRHVVLAPKVIVRGPHEIRRAALLEDVAKVLEGAEGPRLAHVLNS